jgi:hypothetical protein
MPFLSSRTVFVTIIPLKATFVFPVHEIFHDIVLDVIHLPYLLSYCLLFASLLDISHLPAYFLGMLFLFIMLISLFFELIELNVFHTYPP